MKRMISLILLAFSFLVFGGCESIPREEEAKQDEQGIFDNYVIDGNDDCGYEIMIKQSSQNFEDCPE